MSADTCLGFKLADGTSSDLQSFREALTVLQRQVDELDGMKGQHYQEIMEHEEEVWDVVQAKVRNAPEIHVAILIMYCTGLRSGAIHDGCVRPLYSQSVSS